MANSPDRKVITRGIALWQNAPSPVVWFELGKDWAHGLIDGNWWEREYRALLFNTIAPGFGTAMDLVLQYYRGKLKKYLGPNGIWIAVKVPIPSKATKALTYVYAKKRTDATKLQAPNPWEPARGNIL